MINFHRQKCQLGLRIPTPTHIAIETPLKHPKNTIETPAAKKDKNKKSGRELFMTDQNLIDSDIKFLADTGDQAVTVDESLFEDLDDLDLDDEDESDPDWDPAGGDSD